MNDEGSELTGEHAVVRDVRIRHEKAIVANRRHAAARRGSAAQMRVLEEAAPAASGGKLEEEARGVFKVLRPRRRWATIGRS